MTTGPGRPRHDDVLTPAEWKVAEQVRHGMTNRRIAERMGVSLDAVKFHVSNALGKLGFSSREQLRRWDGVARGTALDQLRRSAMDAENSYLMLGQVARTTKRFDKSRSWYRDTLGLPELYCVGNLAFFDLGGVRMMLTEEAGELACEIHPLPAGPGYSFLQSRARNARRQVHERAAPHPSARGRDGGMDGGIQGQ